MHRRLSLWPADPNQPLAEGELERLVVDSRATYERFRHVVVVDTIPRLPSGKVLRSTLREELSRRSARSSGGFGADEERRECVDELGHAASDLEREGFKRGGHRRRR